MRSQSAIGASPHRSTEHGRGRRNGSRSASARPADLRHALHELDDAASELQREVEHDDGSDEARIAVGTSKRTLAERLEVILKRIVPALSAYEYLLPGIEDQLNTIWFHPPEIAQGASSWLGYAGRLRRLLLDALAEDPNDSTQAITSSARRDNSHAELSTMAVLAELGQPHTAIREPELVAAESGKLHTVKQAAALLNVKPGWLYERTRKDAIPHRRLGKYRLFSDSDLREIAEKCASRGTGSL